MWSRVKEKGAKPRHPRKIGLSLSLWCPKFWSFLKGYLHSKSCSVQFEAVLEIWDFQASNLVAPLLVIFQNHWSRTSVVISWSQALASSNPKTTARMCSVTSRTSKTVRAASWRLEFHGATKALRWRSKALSAMDTVRSGVMDISQTPDHFCISVPRMFDWCLAGDQHGFRESHGTLSMLPGWLRALHREVGQSKGGVARVFLAGDASRWGW